MIEREELMLDFPFYSMPIRVLKKTTKYTVFNSFDLKRNDKLQFKIATIDRDVVGLSKHKINVEVYCNDVYMETVGLRRLQTILTDYIEWLPYALYAKSSAFRIKNEVTNELL